MWNLLTGRVDCKGFERLWILISVGVESWGTSVPLIPREDCASFIGEPRQTLKKPSWRLLANHTAYSWAVCLFLEGNLR